MLCRDKGGQDGNGFVRLAYLFRKNNKPSGFNQPQTNCSGKWLQKPLHPGNFPCSICMRNLPYKCGELTSVQREDTTKGKSPTGVPFSEGT